MRKRICYSIVLLYVMFGLSGCIKDNGELVPNKPTKPVTTDLSNSTDQDNDIEILFINVGKADSALVSIGDNHYLIDTGLVESLPAVVKALRLQGVDKLNGIFLTHTDSDHVGGLEGLLQLFSVDKIYGSEITTNKKNGNNVMDEKAARAGHTIHRLKVGDEIILDPQNSQVKFEVIGPIVFNPDDDNDNSLVMVLDANLVTCLFTGDMQFAQERTLLNANAIKPCTILKVGNHGNPDASSIEFITAASPEFAIFSTNSVVEPDTPAPNIVSALQSIKAEVFVTQEAKTGILATINAEQVTVERISKESIPPVLGIGIESLDRKSELMVLKNDSEKAVDLTNWWIYSERGNEMFFFPKGQMIGPNDKLSISSGKNPPQADLIWAENNVWHDTKSDSAIIFDAMGNEMIIYDIN